jgi:RNA polymerase sigma factor (sigma-70 family)
MEPYARPARGLLSEAEELALLQRIAVADRSAFDRLYRDYWPRLTRFLERVTRHPGQVEELLNDTMLTVWHKAGSFRAESRVSSWIFGIAYRKAMKALRTARGRAAEVCGTDDTICARDEDGPESSAMRAQARRQLTQALTALPPEQRAVVELTYYHGYAYAEIATIVGCPVDTVKTRMFHARRKLRLLLEAQSEEG